MMYSNEIEKEARDFITDNRDMMVKALIAGADWDYNDIEDLDAYWHETIVDRGYTVADAEYILDNCENEETDSGIWEGLDYRDEMSARAAYSYSNDVWFKCENMFSELKDRMEEIVEDEKCDNEKAANLAFDEFEQEGEVPFQPVEKDSDEELNLIRRWIRTNRDDAGIRGGYPVGGSYIDARCGTGHGMIEVKEYVEFDHEFSRKVPWLSGKYKEAVQIRHDELVEARRNKCEVKYGELDSMNGKNLKEAIPKKILFDGRLNLNDIREIIENLERGVY